MQTDEQQIRALVSTWMEATRSGDVDTVLDLGHR
jgi:ketosteroid isomerase-like protein